MDSIENSLYIMAKRISTLRETYHDISNDAIVPSVLAKTKQNWNLAANYEVIELNAGKFHVKYTSSDGYGTDQAHILEPGKRRCSCGHWTDNWFPCKHACAYARKVQMQRERQFIDENTSDIHKGICLKATFHTNINLIVTHTVNFDGTSKPNPIVKRQGRPRTKRLRRRKK